MEEKQRRGKNVGAESDPGSLQTDAVARSRSPLLTIPSETEGSAEFKSRLSELIESPSSHIYIDTSFLMWMTKIGSPSRQELVKWLSDNCDGRVHVPIWAAHEYLKHHVSGTILAELKEKTDEIVSLVGRTYTYFRPFIDEAYGDGAEDPETIRAATRSALNGLDRLVATSRQWQKVYQKHASEVIAFINAHSLERTKLFDYFADLQSIGAGRFLGSVPPGFQDRRKGGADKSEDGPSLAPAGSNRYGDLVFWKELLEHAKEVNARALIIFTNDRKNDWHLGRTTDIRIEPDLLALKKAWKPIPRAHPMLATEAKLVAGVDQVELLDSQYLAALLREMVEEQVRAFADVGIIPDDATADNETDRRARLHREMLDAIQARKAADASEKGLLFIDAPEVVVTSATMRRALLESRQPVGERAEALLSGWRADVDDRRPLAETFTAEKIDGLDQKELVRLGRELHDRVLNQVPGYEEALVDLLSLLTKIPTNTAGSLYLGFLASMYLTRDRNSSRIPPRSPCAQQLFEAQHQEFAAAPIEALAKRLQDNDVGPLYVPRVDRAPVDVVMDTETDTSGLDELRSLRINDVELLIEAQPDESLRLSHLFEGSAQVDGDDIVKKACQLFAVPADQVKRGDSFLLKYSLSATIGFKRPMDVAIPKEKTLG